jgi:hypothetical protein
MLKFKKSILDLAENMSSSIKIKPERILVNCSQLNDERISLSDIRSLVFGNALCHSFRSLGHQVDLIGPVKICAHLGIITSQKHQPYDRIFCFGNGNGNGNGNDNGNIKFIQLGKVFDCIESSDLSVIFDKIAKLTEINFHKYYEKYEHLNRISPQKIMQGFIIFSNLEHIASQKLSISFENVTCPYYHMYARICSLIEICRHTSTQQPLPSCYFDIDFQADYDLCFELVKIDAIINQVNLILDFSPLCQYLKNLSQTAHIFYKTGNFYSISKCSGHAINIHYNRVVICLATKNVFERCFQILGLAIN